MSVYPWRGGPLPIELANTLFAEAGRAVDALSTPDELADWLRANARHFPDPVRAAAVDPLGLERFRVLRTAVRELLGAAVEANPPPLASLQVLNRLSQQAPYFPRLDWLDGETRLMLVDVAGLELAALAGVARATIALLASTDRGRIGVCQAPGCVLFFMREHRRRDWCSSTCGNRARVARHYQRHRGASTAEAPADSVAAAQA